MKLFTILILFSFLYGCGTASRYQVIGDDVIYMSPWGERQIEGADAATFQFFEHSAFSRDKKHVYFGAEVVIDADPATFEVLDFHTGRDANSIFRASSRCEECDYDSFRQISSDWYVDKYAAYSSLSNGWKRIEGVDSQSFEVLNDWFAKDKNYVYNNSFRIPGADASSFKLGSCGICKVCGEDKNRCYWFRNAVPCDCESRSGIDFPKALPVMAPGNARIISLHFKNAVHVVSVDGEPEVASFNFELPEGERVLGIKCPDIDENVTETTKISVKAGRMYTLLPHDGKTCQAQLEGYAIVRGRDVSPQIRINDLPYKPGNKVKPNGLFEVKLKPGHHTLSVTCLDVRSGGVKEASTTVDIITKSRYFYELDAQFKGDDCKVSVVVDEPL